MIQSFLADTTYKQGNSQDTEASPGAATTRSLERIMAVTSQLEEMTPVFSKRLITKITQINLQQVRSSETNKYYRF